MPERIGLVAELDLSQFDRAVNSYIRSVNRMERATHNVADSMVVAYARLGGVIATTIGGVTAAVGGIAVASAKVSFDWLEEGVEDAATFEQQIAEIGAVLVKTRMEVEPLAQLINKIALDPKLVVSAEEAGAMVEQLARNGVEMADIMDGAARSSILLANATGGDFAMAADVATMAMHMFGLEAKNLNRIADVSQQVINNTRIELDDWKLALGNGGAVAASAGIDIEEFAATIQATINSFHSARQAGTSLMNFVQRLVPITKVAADEFKSLGLYTGLSDEEFQKISTEIAETEQRIADLDPRLVHYDELIQAHQKHAKDLRQELVAGKNAFFDEAGTMKDWGEVVNILIESTKGLSQEERTESFRRMFGNDAMETALALARMSNDELLQLTAQYRETGQAEAAAATRTDTLAKRWENLQDIWDSIRRLSGAKFIGMLDNLVKRLTALTGQNQDRIIEFFGRMAELLDRIVTAAMPWVDRMLPVLINNLEALASWLVELVLKGDRTEEWFGKMHPTLQKFLNRIFDIVAMGRRFLTWLTDTGKKIREVLRPFTDWVVENVTLKDALIAAAGAVTVFLAPLGVLIARMAIAGVAAAKAVSFIRRAWVSDLNNIRTIFTNLWPKIQQPLFSFINNFLMGRWVRAWDDAVKVVVTALTDIERYLPDFFKPFARFISAILQGQWGRAWDSFVDIIRNTFEAIKIGLAQLRHPFTDFILRILEGRWIEAWEIFQRTAVRVLNFLTDRLPVFFKPFGSFITNVLEGDWWEAWNDAQQIAINVYKAIVTGLDMIGIPFTRFLSNVLQGRWAEAWEQVKNFAVGAFEFIKEQLRGLNTPFTNFIANILEGKWAEAWDQIKEWARLAYEWIITKLSGFGSRFARLAVAIMRGAWRLAWDLVKEMALDAFNKIIGILRGFNTPFTNFLANVLQGKWKLAWKQMQNAAVGALTWLKGRLPAVFSPLMDTLIAMVEGRWGDAWTNAKIFAIEALEEIRDFFGGNIISDMIDILINFIEGDWAGMWYMIRSVAIEALYWLRDNVLPEILDPIADMLINMINGDWARAWDDAKKFVLGVRDAIVEWLDKFDTPFTNFIARILEGKWRDAWEEAKTMALNVRDAIVEWLDGFDSPFTNFFARVLEGEWKLAWEEAKTSALIVRDALVEWLADKGPWGTFATEILQGEWKGAWESAKELVFGEQGVFTRLENWLTGSTRWSDFAKLLLDGDFGTAWTQLKDNIFGEEGVFTKIEQWLTGTTRWSEFFKLLVDGDFGAAWVQLKENLFGEEGLFRKIEMWLTGTTKWSDFFKLLVDGDFGAAWLKLSDNLFGEQGVFTKIEQWLTGTTRWSEFFNLLTTGDFNAAWVKFKDNLFGEEGVFRKIELWLTGSTKWTDFAKLVFDGEFGLAWTTFKDMLFLEPDGLFPKILAWLADTGPWGQFARNLLTGEFGLAWTTLWSILWSAPDGIFYKLNEWLKENPGPWSEFAQNVLMGQWVPAWDALKIAVGLTDDNINTFKDSIYILIGAFALAIATMVSFQVRGLVGIALQLGALAGTIFKFIPVVGAIALAVAMLRVAWEEDFLGIQAFTARTFKSLGVIFEVGLILFGELVSAFMSFMAEDWESGWEHVHNIARLAWQAISNLALTGLNLIYKFMVDGPGKNIIAWLGEHMPATLEGLGNVFTAFVSLWNWGMKNTSSDSELAAAVWTEALATIDIALATLANSIAGMISLLQYYSNMVLIVSDSYGYWMKAQSMLGSGMDALAAGDLATATTQAQGIADLMTEVVPTLLGQRLDDVKASLGGVGDSIKGMWEAWTSSEENTAPDVIQNMLNGIIEKQNKIKEGSTDVFGDLKESSEYKDWIEAIETAFGMASDPNVTSGIPMADILRDAFVPSSPFMDEMGDEWVSGWKKWYEKIRTAIADAEFPAIEGLETVDPEHPITVFKFIMEKIKELGVSLTGDFLNSGTAAVDALGQGAAAETETVKTIFEQIMGEIRSVASGLVEDFKELGGQIGAGVAVGMEEEEETIRNAAQDMIDAAILAMEAAAEIESPSKKFMELGSLSGQGYVEGWRQQIAVLESLLVSHIEKMKTYMSGMAQASQIQMPQATNSTFNNAVGGAGATSNITTKTLRDFIDAMRHHQSGGRNLNTLALQNFFESMKNFQPQSSNIDTNTLRDFSEAIRYYQSRGGNYETTNNSAVNFGPVYINNQMDGAELVYKIQQVMDQRRPF